MQDLETGIQKLKELQNTVGSEQSFNKIDDIITLITQAKDYQEEKDKRSIVWSVDDFITQAEQSFSKYIEARCWQDIYDESKFQNALYEMIRKHDCNNGITWDSINFYLDEYCLKKEKDEKNI